MFSKLKHWLKQVFNQNNPEGVCSSCQHPAHCGTDHYVHEAVDCTKEGCTCQECWCNDCVDLEMLTW